MSSWILTILIFSPLVGVLLLLVPRRGEDLLIAKAALFSAFVTFALSLVALFLFFGAGPGGAGASAFVLNAHVPWVSDNGANIGYRVGVDGISIWLLLLTTFLTPLAIWSSFTSIRTRVREYYALLLLLEVGMLGVFCAKDLLLFYVSFEFTLVPLYFLIGIWGGPERRRAANKFFIYTLAGSVLTFAGVVYLACTAYSATGSLTLEIDELVRLGQSGAITSSAQWWLFLAFAAGFAIKVPLFPVHTWLPLAHTEAPTAGSVMLAGVLLKLGTYGFCRLSIPILPEASFALAPVVAVLSIIGIMYAALAAWVQTDIKKLVAYSSVSHLGFCMLGLFSLKLAGVSGAVLYMVNHGLSTGALFLIVGFIYERYHTRDINAFGGLARKMPWMATFLVFFTLSSIGLPGLNGFVSEFLVLVGTATSTGTADGIAAGPLGYGYVIPAAMGIILGAVYMLWMCRCVLFGPLKEPPNTPDTSTGLTQDLTRRELAILAPIALVCIWLGVYPKPLLETIEPAIVQNILCAPAQPVHAFKDNGRANQTVTTSVAPAGIVGGINPEPRASARAMFPISTEPPASARAVFPISAEPRASARAMPQSSIVLHEIHDDPSRRLQPARTCDCGPRSRSSVTPRGLKPAARRRITVASHTKHGPRYTLDRRNVFPNANEPPPNPETNADAR